MSYATPTSAGGWVDHVVVAAKDAAGNEHPFLVTVEVKEQPSCSTAEKPVGPDAGAFRAVLRGGEIQAIRNVPLVLQPRLFCSADARDSYRVTVNGSVPGAEITSGADGTLVVTWTDPDVVGTGLGTLEFTAWDEVTGVPSAPVKVPVTARDVAPSCNDVEIDYDWDELGGAPLTIPVDCGMVGGMRVLTPPYLTFLGAGLLSEGEGGEFVSDGTSITFTPHDPDVELSTTQVVPWNADPATASPYRPSGAAFFIDVRMS
ncbi:hypothetical protein SCB71_20255 [Herbiconiux sp. KACC 21604]|uniref:hypothetical protein n=1 Tax=unclassified Herbiconiux TaxID=2618217 RepID=UPI0014929BA8|nr:hypothetical protein [Herbiconiux sp. SALV-R1]QJU55358.1 hypothetical protein HL652_18180 [Herbiconiux sp. SALV-R1]WPO86529.1 hypothetical protein SCB71_20255 [Herbiconiux sp. KACC 21604]